MNTTIPSLKIPDVANAEEEIDLIKRAALLDAKRCAVESGLSSHVAIIFTRALPVSKEKTIAAQKPIVAMAMENYQSKELKNALKEAKDLHQQSKALCEKLQAVLHSRVGTE